MFTSIEFKNINKQYEPNYYAIFNFNYNFLCGKNYLVYGEDLSGKSTLLRLFCGLEKQSSGEILLNERELKDDDIFYKNEIVFLPTKQVFFENKTVLQNLQYAYSIRNNDKNFNFENVLNSFNLNNISNKKVKSITTFERVMLSLARANLREFTFLLIDECLDFFNNNEIDSIFEKIRQIKYKTLIITTKQKGKFSKFNFETIELKAGCLQI